MQIHQKVFIFSLCPKKGLFILLMLKSSACPWRLTCQTVFGCHINLLQYKMSLQMKGSITFMILISQLKHIVVFAEVEVISIAQKIHSGSVLIITQPEQSLVIIVRRLDMGCNFAKRDLARRSNERRNRRTSCSLHVVKSYNQTFDTLIRSL